MASPQRSPSLAPSSAADDFVADGIDLTADEDRRRTNQVLERMMAGMPGDDDEFEPTDDDDEDDEDEDDEDEDEDEDEDYVLEEDDDDELEEGMFLDVDEGEEVVFEDEEGGEEEDEEDEEGDDDEGGQIIDLSAILQAAAANRNTDGGDGDDDEEASANNTLAALNSLGLEGLRRLISSGRIQIRRGGGRTAANNDDDDDDDDEIGSYPRGGLTRNGAKAPMSDYWDPIVEPVQAGKELLLGGEFGRPPPRPSGQAASAFSPSRNLSTHIAERKRAARRVEKHVLGTHVPNSDGTEVARYSSRCYCGQYSEDSSFFYTCTQDFQVHMYDTTASPYKKPHRYDIDSRNRFGGQRHMHMSDSHLTSLKPIKTIQGRQGSWTITDANLSPDNQWMIYSSITPYVHLVPTRKEIESGGRMHSDNQVMLDFSGYGSDDAGVRSRTGIWSIRFSGDSREIVAGAHYGAIYVYDIEARRRVLRVSGHRDDVNGVAFADSASSNVLISGSDDSYVKVWDRRSLSGGKPAGVLPGHTEGITYVAPKGDGRYCISNGKDQSCKLWDLRMLVSSEDFSNMSTSHFGLKNWDYRTMTYKKPRYQSHPEDRSVMTYRGHAVLRTLIRCHFSPMATTGQQYIYSGSADGRIHIWGLDGRVVQVLDRSNAVPLCSPGSDEASDPSAPAPSPEQAASIREAQERAMQAQHAAGYRNRSSYWGRSTIPDQCTVRDVSWHSSEPAIMSTAWDGPDSYSGSIAKHEWKGYGKNGLSLEDAVERSILEGNR